MRHGFLRTWRKNQQLTHVNGMVLLVPGKYLGVASWGVKHQRQPASRVPSRTAEMGAMPRSSNPKASRRTE